MGEEASSSPKVESLIVHDVVMGEEVEEVSVGVRVQRREQSPSRPVLPIRAASVAGVPSTSVLSAVVSVRSAR